MWLCQFLSNHVNSNCPHQWYWCFMLINPSDHNFVWVTLLHEETFILMSDTTIRLRWKRTTFWSRNEGARGRLAQHIDSRKGGTWNEPERTEIDKAAVREHPILVGFTSKAGILGQPSLTGTCCRNRTPVETCMCTVVPCCGTVLPGAPFPRHRMMELLSIKTQFLWWP